MLTNNNGLRCKGCWLLGNNCGECDECIRTARETIGIIRELRDETEKLWAANKALAESNLRAKDKAKADFKELKQLVIDMRKYVIHHGLLMGECVAWNALKQMTNVGQTTDCLSEKGYGE